MTKPDLVALAEMALEYIDAIPLDVVAALPAMPGFDRDWAEQVLEHARHLASQPSLYEATLKFAKEKIAAAIAALPADGGETEQSHSDADWQRLLNSRDNFIVKKGLWSEFVESLPGPSEATPSTAGSVREALEVGRPSVAWWLNEIELCNERMWNGSKETYFGQIKKSIEAIRRALSAPVEAPVAVKPRPERRFEIARIIVAEYEIPSHLELNATPIYHQDAWKKALRVADALQLGGSAHG